MRSAFALWPVGDFSSKTTCRKNSECQFVSTRCSYPHRKRNRNRRNRIIRRRNPGSRAPQRFSWD